MTPEMRSDRPTRNVRGEIGAEARARLLAATPFGGLGEGVARVLPLLVERRLDPNTVVFGEGESGSGFFILAEGRLRIFRTLQGGREITVFLLQPGASFGFLPLLDGRPLPVSVAAMKSSTVLFIERADFLRLLRAEPGISLGLLEYVSSRLRECMDQLGMLGQPGALSRTAYGLLSLVPDGAPRKGVATVTLPSSQEELAKVLHVSPENLSRALRKLRERGLLERLGPRRFRILSIEALRRAADGD